MFRNASLIAAAILLAGCSGIVKTGEDGSTDGPVVVDSSEAGQNGEGAQAYGINLNNRLVKGTLLDALGNVVSLSDIQSIFYFDYDKSTINPKSYDALEQHAKYLKDNAGSMIRLEGHTDSRGTREYNIALGERRGQSIHSFFRTRGVSPSQVDIVSYGEEKPASQSDTKNRRVEVSYDYL